MSRKCLFSPVAVTTVYLLSLRMVNLFLSRLSESSGSWVRSHIVQMKIMIHRNKRTAVNVIPSFFMKFILEFDLLLNENGDRFRSPFTPNTFIVPQHMNIKIRVFNNSDFASTIFQPRFVSSLSFWNSQLSGLFRFSLH